MLALLVKKQQLLKTSQTKAFFSPLPSSALSLKNKSLDSLCTLTMTEGQNYDV